MSKKFIENKGLVTLTPGPGIANLTCNDEINKCVLDSYLILYAKEYNNIKVDFLDNDKNKNYLEAMKRLKYMVELIAKKMAKNPPTLKKIKEDIKLTICVGAHHLDKSLNNNLIQILEDKYNIEFIRKLESGLGSGLESGLESES